MATWEATNEAAEALGCSRATLKRWRAKMPPDLWKPGESGQRLYDVEAVRAWREGRPNPGRPVELDRLLDEPETPRAQAPIEDAPDLTDEDREALGELLEARDLGDLLRLADRVPAERVKKLAALARLRRELAEADKRERQNNEAEGELVPLEDVRRAWAAQVEIVKARFRALPSLLAQRLVGRGYDEMHDTIEEELHGLLVAFSREELV